MNNPKKIRWWLYFIIAVLIILLIKECRGHEVKPIGHIPDSVFYWKNKANQTVISLKGAQEDFAIKEKIYLDSIAKIYKTKPKYIKEIVTLTEQAEGSVEPSGSVEKDYQPVIIPDCPPIVKNMRQRFTNNYYDISTQIGDSSYLHLLAYDTLTVLWKKVKEGNIFNRKFYTQVDAATANPYNKISGLKAFRVADKKPKKFGVGIQAGYGYSNGLQPKVYVGIGITYIIIRF